MHELRLKSGECQKLVNKADSLEDEDVLTPYLKRAYFRSWCTPSNVLIMYNSAFGTLERVCRVDYLALLLSLTLCVSERTSGTLNQALLCRSLYFLSLTISPIYPLFERLLLLNTEEIALDLQTTEIRPSISLEAMVILFGEKTSLYQQSMLTRSTLIAGLTRRL